MPNTKRKKKRTHVVQQDDPSKKGPPKSFVFGRGQHAASLKNLEGDLRKLMEPYTARHLKESKRNQLKDFVDVAGPLGISHFLILTATEHASYLKLAKTPRGPTLTMQIHSYSLMGDVAASQTRPRAPNSLWQNSPLVVMNSFAGSDGLELASVMFTSLFPAINVHSAKLSQCQRVVLLNYNKETNLISFRQYGITATPSGVSKSVKSLIGKRAIPDMSKFEDVAEFLTKSGYGSESEGEDAAETKVTLPQDMGRGNLAARQSRVRLQEVGPRMELEIVKAEEGMCAGKVLYHQHITKTEEEVAAQTAQVKSKEELREKRRKQQEENVKRKENKKRKAEGQDPEEGGKEKAGKKTKKDWWESPSGDKRTEKADDDLAHYRQEVGEDPDDTHGLSGASRHTSGQKFKQHNRSKEKFDSSKPSKKASVEKKRSSEKTDGKAKERLKGGTKKGKK